MANPTTPTHTITHRGTGTTAHVRLPDRLHPIVDARKTPEENDQKFIAVCFKETQPVAGPNLSREFVDYADLVIAPDRRRHDFDEEPGPRMGPGGVVLDKDEGCTCDDSCRNCDIGYHGRSCNCPL